MHLQLACQLLFWTVLDQVLLQAVSVWVYHYQWCELCTVLQDSRCLFSVLSHVTSSLSLCPPSSINHRHSILSPPSSHIPQSSVHNRLSMISPPVFVTHQLLVFHLLSVVSPWSSLSHQSIIVSFCCAQCPSTQPTDCLLISIKDIQWSITCFCSFQAVWFKKWPRIHFDKVSNKAFCLTCMKHLRLAILKCVQVREMTIFGLGGTVTGRMQVGTSEDALPLMNIHVSTTTV